MTEFLRGAVVKATFEIEYPDGSRKVADVDNPTEIGSIVFDAASVPAGDIERFNVSASDWKQNPSMLIFPKGAGAESIPYCTHNDCNRP